MVLRESHLEIGQQIQLNFYLVLQGVDGVGELLILNQLFLGLIIQSFVFTGSIYQVGDDFLATLYELRDVLVLHLLVFY